MKLAPFIAAGVWALATTTCASAGDLYLVDHYRADADPEADLARAEARAQVEGKRILIEVGGDWCVWCHILDGYIDAHRDVKDAYAQAFVIMKVNWARDDERNEAFLARFPPRAGYPHFFILDADGGLLASQDTVELEDGDCSYDHDAMMAFARGWRPDVG